MSAQSTFLGPWMEKPNAWTIVGTLLLAWLCYQLIRIWREREADAAFARQHGCLPVESVLPHDWPLGLDLLKKQYDAAQDERLLAFQSSFLKEMPTMKVHILGGVGYFTTDPQLVEAVLHTNFQDWGFGSRTGSVYPLLGEGIFTQEGTRWKHSREMLRHQFAHINFRDLRIFDSHVNSMLRDLQATSGIVDLQKVFLQYTFATTTSLIFGDAVDDAEMRDRALLGGSFDYAQVIAAMRMRLGDFYWVYNPKRFREATETIKIYAMNCVEQVLSGAHSEHKKPETRSLIRELYGELQDKQLVRDQLIHVLTAGRDTTAFTMSWVMFLLVRHPKCLERLRAEIASVVPEDEQLTRSHLIEMPYLRNVINETLRLYPQLPANVKFANKRTVLPTGGGPDGRAPVFVPKNVVVGYSVYHMHRRVDLYGPDAEIFRPERWEESDLEKSVGWGYVSFHGGPRVCLGKEFALAEASYGLVAILRAFPDLRLPPDVKPEPTGQEKQIFGMFVASADGCKVLLE